MAGGECKEDRQKFCKEVIDAKGDTEVCMQQHQAELSDACKAKREAKKSQTKRFRAYRVSELRSKEGRFTP